jgi:hypothetical protein
VPTSFDFAPPGKTVDGLAAVPIDIQHITAALIFDGATSSGTGDATIDFMVGPGGGCPIFDLRQTINSVEIDGTPLAVADAVLHDFGGGSGAELRVLNQVLAGGSTHLLRVTYSLGTPQASTAGSYQPRMTFSAAIIAEADGPALPQIPDSEFDNLFVLTACQCRRGLGP